ncbi:unnamed protein product, partial [Heterotrigona itama]
YFIEANLKKIMSLLTDASPNNLNYNYDNILNKDILWRIENDLDIDEKMSVLFLMIDDYEHSFQEIYDLLQKFKEDQAFILTEFVNIHPNNWENKLLEAICVINNRQIIRKLGISFESFSLFYMPKIRSYSRYINLVAKCLYLLCEALCEDKTKLLLQYIQTDLTPYEENLKNIDFLETFEDLELICEDLKKHENHQNVLDTQHSINTSHVRMSFMEESPILSEVEENDIRKLNSGLCIIISQMFFEDRKFETRFGNAKDCETLSETFRRFGFTVTQFNNLTEDKILTKLENIPKDFGTNYDCIFVCILSHGCKGGIISAEGKEVSIEAIEHKFCCAELEDVIKVIIIQACQGNVKGQVNVDETTNLTTDGRTDCKSLNILPYKNFCIFMSTMQGFISVRHKEEGSWFIQEFCNILQNGKNKITFLEAIRKTIFSVMKKKGKLNETSFIAQLPELKTCRLLTDFQLPDYQEHI